MSQSRHFRRLKESLIVSFALATALLALAATRTLKFETASETAFRGSANGCFQRVEASRAARARSMARAWQKPTLTGHPASSRLGPADKEQLSQHKNRFGGLGPEPFRVSKATSSNVDLEGTESPPFVFCMQLRNRARPWQL